MIDHEKPYAAAFFPPKPTKGTRFWRTFPPYQLLRFLVINIKMIRIITKGH